MENATTNTSKRKAEEIIIDPDTKQIIESSKRAKIELDPVKKFKCLSAIVDMYGAIITSIVTTARTSVATHAMDVDGTSDTSGFSGIRENINVGNHIISIIFTVHNINRQKTKKIVGNMEKKTEKTTFKVNFKGKEYSMQSEVVNTTWITILKKQELEYKDFSLTDSDNWYGTMGPYLDMFAAFPLRVNELRLGHNNMPISKEGGIHRSFPVSKYGLSGAHHILLEGTSFPPERRSSIVQSLGPMTSWLCMLRSEGVYRKKYAASVKRAMSHVPCIDDLIEITKTIKQASEISMITTLIAETLLVTTSRQASRMYFPITIFAKVWNNQESKQDFSKFFNTTGAGGWFLYKQACELGQFNISGKMESEKAAQKMSGLILAQT